MKPEPMPRTGACFGIGTAKRLKNSDIGSSSSNGIACEVCTSLVTLMFTTAGPACWTSAVKSGPPWFAARLALTEGAVALAAAGEAAVEVLHPAANAGIRTASSAALILGGLNFMAAFLECVDLSMGAS